jgi:hypothetical protein
MITYIMGILTGIAMVLAFLAGQHRRLKRQLAQIIHKINAI